MGGSARKEIAGEAQRIADAQFEDYDKQAKAQKKVLDKQRQEYKDMKFTNPYEDMQNQYANMENVYEDITVNQQQAQFQAQQGAQQRANIMQGLRGAAGGTGIAALAQTLASQGQLQTQQISASIGTQEAQNQALKAKGAMAIQSAERGGEAAVDLQKRQGDAMVQQAESAKIGTLLGMEYGAMAGINQGKQAAMANQMSAIQLEAEMKSAAGAATKGVWGEVIGLGATLAGAAGSDRRLKKNINKTGESPSGLNIYSFNYKDAKYGEGLFQGVMSDEIPQEAVHRVDGYDIVDYSMLDVEFKKID